MGGDILAKANRQQQHDHAKRRGFTDFSGADMAHVDAHDHGQRDSDRDGEGAPGAFTERFDHYQTQRGEDDDHDGQGADQGDAAGDRTHFHLDHFAQ